MLAQVALGAHGSLGHVVGAFVELDAHKVAVKTKRLTHRLVELGVRHRGGGLLGMGLRGQGRACGHTRGRRADAAQKLPAIEFHIVSLSPFSRATAHEPPWSFGSYAP